MTLKTAERKSRCFLFFRTRLVQSVAFRVTNLRVAVVCCRKSLCLQNNGVIKDGIRESGKLSDTRC